MLDGERKTAFQEIFVNFCFKLEEYRKRIDVPKMPIFEIKGSIIDDIQKANHDEESLRTWEKETSDFHVVESISAMQIDFYTFLNSINSDPSIILYLKQLEHIANNNVVFTRSFIHNFFTNKDEFTFDEDKFNSLWNEFESNLYADKLECYILIPICNFYSFKKELTKGNITCRLVDFSNDEHYYYLMQVQGEQPLESFGFPPMIWVLTLNQVFSPLIFLSLSIIIL